MEALPSSSLPTVEALPSPSLPTVEALPSPTLPTVEALPSTPSPGPAPILRLRPPPVGQQPKHIRFCMVPWPLPHAVQLLPPLAVPAMPPSGNVFPGPTARVFAGPGEDSTTSNQPPHVHQPPYHLDLYNLASMASRSRGSHVESPVAVPSALLTVLDGGITVPPSTVVYKYMMKEIYLSRSPTIVSLTGSLHNSHFSVSSQAGGGSFFSFVEQ